MYIRIKKIVTKIVLFLFVFKTRGVVLLNTVLRIKIKIVVLIIYISVFQMPSHHEFLVKQNTYVVFLVEEEGSG